MMESATLKTHESMLKPSQKVLNFIFSYAASFDVMNTEMLGATGFMKN